jgi:hypothetical protein
MSLAPLIPKNIKAVLTGIFLLMTSFSGYAGESVINTEIGNEIIKKAIFPVLIAHKICSGDQSSDAQSCWFHGDHIWMSAKGGIQFFIYGISDRKLINELLVAIIQASNQYPPDLQFSVDVFAHPYSERSIWKRPIAQLLIKGEK